MADKKTVRNKHSRKKKSVKRSTRKKSAGKLARRAKHSVANGLAGLVPRKKAESPELDLHKILTESRGRHTQQFINGLPEVMSELTKQLIDQPDIRVRNRLRKMMRGVFDCIMADTKHPAEMGPVEGKKGQDDSGI